MARAINIAIVTEGRVEASLGNYNTGNFLTFFWYRSQQSLFHVGQDIRQIFDAHRETHEPIGNTLAQAVFT